MDQTKSSPSLQSIGLISLEQATALLQQGQVVALPTETVYGLAALINQEEALKNIFKIKQRPLFDPLIVHVESIAMAQPLVESIDELSLALMNHFWPGPLTILRPKSKRISDLITAGLLEVGLRSPNHPVAQKILKSTQTPFAAPSANLFGKTSPTTAAHVLEEFNQQIAVVDGGPAEVGLESTVLRTLKEQGQWIIEILRPGGVTSEQLKSFAEKHWSSPILIRRAFSQASPGHSLQHYQPTKPLWLLQPGSQLPCDAPSAEELKLNADPLIAARELYAQLRKASDSEAEIIFFQLRKEHQSPAWEAHMDRLTRASSKQF